MGLLNFFSRTTVESLGKGISGTVERHDVGTASYVVKTYHSKESYESRAEYRDRVLHEYEILKKINHRNFIEVLRYEVSYDGATVKMYMEAGSRDLYILLKNASVDKVPVHEVLCLWKQACTGIQYLHGTGICHRDLKLENMVLDPRNKALKIIDLATAAPCNKPAAGMVGSRRYMAPEAYAQITYEGAAADIWSLGIILFYMITRRFPWKEASHADTQFVAYASSSRPALKFRPLIGSITQEGVDALESMLRTRPDKRANVEDICQSSWFMKIRSCEDDASCSPHILGVQSEVA